MTNSPKVIDGPILTSWQFFWQIVLQHKIWLVLSVAMVVLASGLSAGTSYFFKLIIEAVEAGNLESAFRYGLLYPLVILGVQSLYRASGLSTAHLVVKVAKTTTDTLMEYLLRHNHTYFSNRFAGAVTNKVRNVTNALDQIIPDLLWGQLDTLVSFLVTFVLLWSVDSLVAILFALLLVALIIVSQLMAKRKAYLSKVNAEMGTKLQGRTVDLIGNVGAVRQYAHEQFELEQIKLLSTKKQETSLATWLYTERLLFVNSLLIFVFALMMFWLLVTRWEERLVTTGEFILVLALVSQITGTLLFVGRAINNIARTIGELREGLEDIYQPYDIIDINEAKPLSIEVASIEWENVTFAFDREVIFANFSLRVAGHQRIGLVGQSGAGKSTFVSLLLRQHDLVGGQILIDGQDISTVTQDSLRQAIAIVPQEPALFHRTIRENIAYGNLDASLEAVERVAKLAYAHEFIKSLPLGYETMVGERGVKLSGGQKQRIAIARAMLKDAPILILDEATSALDSESELLIQQALHTLMTGKTVIAIAHRLSTLREMDRIVVLDKGKIVEDGTPESLKNESGLYARLWAHQAGGFLVS